MVQSFCEQPGALATKWDENVNNLALEKERLSLYFLLISASSDSLICFAMVQQLWECSLSAWSEENGDAAH